MDLRVRRRRRPSRPRPTAPRGASRRAERRRTRSRCPGRAPCPERRIMLRARSTIAHRLAHVEHEDLAAAADRARLDDQRDRLRDRHEEAGHLRVRDRHRAAALDLAAEDRDHAARRAEHVAEAHGDEARRDVVARAVRLDDPLAERLRLAHHRLRVDGLVGRDEHEPLDAELDRDLARSSASRACCSAPTRAGSPPSAARACRRRRGRRRSGV